jgi:hypothetical protein
MAFTPKLWEPYERAMARGLVDKQNRELREMFYGKDEPIGPTEGA